MAKAKKTQSGRYRVTVFDYTDSTGKQHQKTFTADTKTEARRLAREYKSGPKLSDLTVGEAVKGYIDSRKNVLSPSTHRSYMSTYRTHFESSLFGSLKLSSLDNITVQRFISDLDLKPKTVKNINGLLVPALKMYMPEKHFIITLPAAIRPDLYTPTTGEVDALIESIKQDHELHIFSMLCAFGPLRRSEACAIRYEDIDYKTNTILIRRARVRNDDGEWVYKDRPKTDASYRSVIFPSDVIKAIGRGFGYVLDESTPQALSDRFKRARDRAGLPHFRVHDLRHYAASIFHAIGIPDQYIMARGGWKTDHMMKRVYRDTLSDVEKEMQKKAVDYFDQAMLQAKT
jgi:integrase